MSDSYKYSHPWQYPPKTEVVSSYIESRGYNSNFFKNGAETVFFGLDYTINQYFNIPFNVRDIKKLTNLAEMHGIPCAEEGFRYILSEHDGYMPVQIAALPEGTVVPDFSIPLVQVHNLDKKVPWVTSFIETTLLRGVWYPTTVATLSREIKKIIAKYLEETGDPNGLVFKLHDFGARGASSHESAALGGLAHLVNFFGTDTFEAIELGYSMYDQILGYSIPASEHSTITSWGRENEVEAFRNMLHQFPTGLVACVSDSYNIYEACRHLWGEVLHDDIMNRDGTLVIRPDSGSPEVVTLEVINILGEKFGFTVNSKGYKVLPSQVRIIQGDGIDLMSIDRILKNFKNNGWSADNIAFGMGGALLQRLDRDTLSFAMKANEAIIDGVPRDVYKDPITSHSKTSKKGRQAVYERDNKLISIPEHEYREELGKNLLIPRWSSMRGNVSHNFENDFNVIRQRAKI